MPARILRWDSTEGYARLRLENDQEVGGGNFINTSTFSCVATGRNILGLPITRIWKFVLTSNAIHERNVVHLDFEEHPPFQAVVGYATQFPSIDAVRQAQGGHADIFDGRKAIDALIKTGIIKEKET